MGVYGSYSINRFHEAEAKYNRVKPVISVNHDRDADIRPLADRRCKHERIHKYDSCTYMLLCDYDSLDPTYYGCGRPDYAYVMAMAPITWRSTVEDGVIRETLRIRNGVVDCAHTRRYQFLEWFLPSNIKFATRSGKQYVTLPVILGDWSDGGDVRGTETALGYRIETQEVMLPKTKYVWEYALGTATPEDNAYLEFEVVDVGDGKTAYKRINALIPVVSNRIDKYEKPKWEQRIADFWTFMCITAPMMRVGKDNVYPRTSLTYIEDWITETRGDLSSTPLRYGKYGIHDAEDIPIDVMREVLTDAEHPLRVAVAEVVAHHISFFQEVRVYDITRTEYIYSGPEVDAKTAQVKKRIRTAFNRTINRTAGLLQTVEV